MLLTSVKENVCFLNKLNLKYKKNVCFLNKLNLKSKKNVCFLNKLNLKDITYFGQLPLQHFSHFDRNKRWV